jgi:hypothetical protein
MCGPTERRHHGAAFLPRIPDGVSVAMVGSLADLIFAAFAGLNYRQLCS